MSGIVNQLKKAQDKLLAMRLDGDAASLELCRKALEEINGLIALSVELLTEADHKARADRMLQFMAKSEKSLSLLQFLPPEELAKVTLGATPPADTGAEPDVRPKAPTSKSKRRGRALSSNSSPADVEDYIKKHPETKVVDRHVYPAGSRAFCSECGDEMTSVGERIGFRIQFVPGTYIIERIHYHTVGCPVCQTPRVRAHVDEGPEPVIIKNSLASISLITHIAVEKFLYHIPLHRSEGKFLDAGLDIRRNTMASWLITAAGTLRPVYGALKRKLRSQPHVNMDETPLQVHREEGRKNNCKSYLWAAVGRGEVPVVVFHYAQTRASSVVRELLGADFGGTLQCDGYSAYRAYAGGVIRQESCLAHVRRKFTKYFRGAKILPGDEYTVNIMKTINAIFLAHAGIMAEKGITPMRVVNLKKERIAPLIDTLEHNLLGARDYFAPESNIARDVKYALKQIPGQRQYLEDPISGPDNNICERVIKELVIGRKNWLFADSPEGAETIAIFQTIVATARANDVDPRQYLEHLLHNVGKASTDEEIEALLPWNFDSGDGAESAEATGDA